MNKVIAISQALQREKFTGDDFMGCNGFMNLSPLLNAFTGGMPCYDEETRAYAFMALPVIARQFPAHRLLVMSVACAGIFDSQNYEVRRQSHIALRELLQVDLGSKSETSEAMVGAVIGMVRTAAEHSCAEVRHDVTYILPTLARHYPDHGDKVLGIAQLLQKDTVPSNREIGRTARRIVVRSRGIKAPDYNILRQRALKIHTVRSSGLAGTPFAPGALRPKTIKRGRGRPRMSDHLPL